MGKAGNGPDGGDRNQKAGAMKGQAHCIQKDHSAKKFRNPDSANGYGGDPSIEVCDRLIYLFETDSGKTGQ